jgi:hypothetical protein
MTRKRHERGLVLFCGANDVRLVVHRPTTTILGQGGATLARAVSYPPKPLSPFVGAPILGRHRTHMAASQSSEVEADKWSVEHFPARANRH